MSPIDSKDSTVTPAIYFAGSLPNGFSTHWNHPADYFEISDDGLHATFGGTFTYGGDRWHFVKEADGDDAYIRALGCALIALMPPKGLGETLSHVLDAFRFYTSDVSVPGAKQLPVRIKGTIVSTSAVPMLDLGE